MDVWMLMSWWIVYHDIGTYGIIRALGVKLNSTEFQFPTILESRDLKI